MANPPSRKEKAKPVAVKKPAARNDKAATSRANAKPVDSGQNYVVFGTVTYADGRPTSGLTIIAYDKDESGTDTLGNPAVTTEAGKFSISYSEADFRKTAKERGGADVVVCVFDAKQELLFTSKKKNNAPADYELNIQLTVSPFVVRGMVKDANGKPLANMVVQAFERDLRHPQLLGKGETGSGGDYRFIYQPADFLLGDSPKRRTPWLIVEVLESSEGKLLARQEVPKATRDQVVSFTLASVGAISEWQETSEAATLRLKGQGSPRIEVASHVSVNVGAARDDLAPWDMTAADVDFISQDAELNRAAVQAWADASRMARDAVSRLTDEHPDQQAVLREHGWPFFYAFARQRQVSDLDSLLRETKANWEKTWNAALAANRVPALNEKHVEMLIQALQLLQRLQQIDPARTADNEFARVLALTPLPLPRTVALDALTIVQDKGLDDSDALLALTERYPESEAPIRIFVRSIRVHRLASGHEGFTRTLNARLEGASDSIAPLARLQATEWISMAEEAGISPGLALRTQAQAETQHPLTALESKIQAGTFDVPGVPVSEVTALIKDQPATVEKLLLGKMPEKKEKADSAAVKALRNTGRFMRTGVSMELAADLIKSGIDSPGAAMRYGREHLYEQHRDRLPKEAVTGVIDAFIRYADGLVEGGKGVTANLVINQRLPTY